MSWIEDYSALREDIHTGYIYEAIEAILGEKGIETASAEVTMVPDTTVHLADKDAEKMQTLIDALEDNDDVQNVYSNYEMDE